MPEFDAADLGPILPEIVLALGGMALLMFGAFRGERSTPLVNAGAIGLLALAALWLIAWPDEGVAFGGAFILDGFARVTKVLIAISAALAVVMTLSYAKVERLSRFEFAILIVFSAVGMMIMVSSGDLIGAYIGLEIQSLAAYVVAAINRDNAKSTEAGLKYFVLGALSSGMLLYGASLIYGFTGQVSFEGIAAVIATEGTSLGLVFGIVFLLSGLAFKISAVPFHMWTPDVYEGAPTPVTAFFAAAPKIAAMALIVRIVSEGFGPVVGDWQQIIVFLAIASMLLGAFAAIGQRNIKRLMAYSSIGHMGYVLVGLASGTQQGVESVVLYLAIYAAMTVGVFACILAMRRNGAAVEEISELAGLARTQPVLGTLLALLMFSLAGIPPLAGFFAKYVVFVAAVEAGLEWLAVIGVLASAVAAFYYLRIVKLIFFDEPAGGFEPMPGELRVVLAASSAFTIFYVFIGAPLGSAAAFAARALF